MTISFSLKKRDGKKRRFPLYSETKGRVLISGTYHYLCQTILLLFPLQFSDTVIFCNDINVQYQSFASAYACDTKLHHRITRIIACDPLLMMQLIASSDREAPRVPVKVEQSLTPRR